MGKAFYRKYRSKSLAEVVGQDHITTALQNALDNNKLSHAYLLTGPRGVGKTSIARILAYAANNLPYDEDGSHIDIIEIDAASNRRIDEIRDLRDKVHIMPTSARYKVYIIDEVHMLTKEAFNALLKTLEEPPAHVIFILATTEAHKLPETIISRTQHYAFRPIDTEHLVSHLRQIADLEKINISGDALELIAQHGNGSFRDSISLLDQAQHSANQIDIDHINRLLGIANNQAVAKLLDSVQSGQADQVLAQLQDFFNNGNQPAQLATQLGRDARKRLLSSNTPDIWWLDLAQSLLDIPASSQPAALLEVVILRHTLERQPNQPAKPVEKKSAAHADQSSTKPKLAAVNSSKAPSAKAPNKPAQPNSTKSEIAGELSQSTWPLVLARIKQQHNTLYGILRMAQAEVVPDEQTIHLHFRYAFHQKQINQKNNRNIIAGIAKELAGQPVAIICDAAKDKEVKDIKESKASPIDNVSNIFGGGEVLQSLE